MSLMRMRAKSHWSTTLVVGQLLMLVLYPVPSARAQTAPVGNGFTINDEDVRYLGSLETEVGEDDTVAILPAVAGG